MQDLTPFRVGSWLAEPALNLLTSDQQSLHIRPQLMDVLACLARHQGRVVLKETLLAEVWPDRVITESGVVRCIAELRQLLGDDPREPRYIETISKRGYRLVARVEWIVPAGDAAGRVTLEAGSEALGAGAAGEGAGEHAAGAVAAGDGEVGDAPRDVDSRGEARAARPARDGLRWWTLAAAALLVAAAAVMAVLVLGRETAAALSDQDTIVLAFENMTGDSVFDDTLPLAVAIQLEQSPFLRILPDEQVRQTLGLMQRPDDTTVTRAVGAEICERAGATVLIVSSIAALGRNYAIGLEAVGCASGEVVGRQQVEVSGKDAVLRGLGRVTAALRRQLGESRASLQAYDVPITEATTASLEALRAMRRGDRARDRGQSVDALRFYREAVGLDPDFALAHARLGGFAISDHYEAEGVEHLTRAFDLRDRVTLPERLEIELIHCSIFSGDQQKMTEILETMRRAYPRRLSARRRLATNYLNTGRYDEALPEALEALKLEPDSAPAHVAVTRAFEATNRLPEARQAAEAAIARGLDSATLHVTLLHIGFITGDADLIARERAWGANHAEAAPLFYEAEAEEAIWRGRLREALDHLDRYQTWARERGAEHRWIVLELRKARFEALCGFAGRARARMRAQLARGDDLGNDLVVDALKVAASAGDLDTIARILERFDAENWPRTEQPFATFVASFRAALETGRGRPERALELLRAVEPFELGLSYGLIPLHERAVAHLAAGDWQRARDAFQKMLDNPGVFPGQKLLPLAQLGRARALAAGGLDTESRQAYEAFFALWADADPDLPLLAQARREPKSHPSAA